MYKRKLRIELAGGLGNQLFGYFAGVHLSRISNRELEYDTKSIDLFRTDGIYNVSSFKIESNIKVRSRHKVYLLIRVTMLQLRDFVTSRSERFKRGITLVAAIFYDQGFCENIATVKKERRTITIKGYFQDFEYFSSCDEDVRKLQLVKPSEWFESQKLLLLNKDVVTMHVRLGDFKNSMKSIGILNTQYYVNGLKALRATENIETWVFSDSIEEAKKICKNIQGISFKFVDTPENSDPAESLVLISMGVKILTSNSTFSIWAGALSKAGTQVACPNSITREHPHTVENLPENWIRIEPVWQEE